MSCGDRYGDLLVNSSGKTADDPCSVFCGPTDYETWKDRARELAVMVGEHWQELARLEDARGVATYREALLAQQHDLVDSYDALPSTIGAVFDGTANYATNVGQAVTVCRKAVCVLELVDDAIASYGGTAPGIPTPTKPAPPLLRGFSLGGLLLPALVVGGVVTLVALRR